MKTIGILGGMGSYATCDLFKRILDHYKVEKEWERPRILIDNNCIMPSRVRAILYNESVDELVEQMSESVDNLVRSGAETIIIGCMTAHYFVRRLPHRDMIINGLDLTAAKVSLMNNGYDICVLCSEGSRKAGIWDECLKSCRLRYPDEQEIRSFIETVKQNKIDNEARKKFADYIKSIPEQAVLLGCTELPLLVDRTQQGKWSKQLIDPIECIIESL